MNSGDHIFFHSKYRRPVVRGQIINRPRLIRLLDSSVRYPLFMVSAPAGYGRTTLLSNWEEKADLPVAWLSLDEDDNELQVFLGYLSMAVKTIHPGALQETTLLNEGIISPPFEILARSVVNELGCVNKEFVLVLDNYEVIQNRQIHNLMSIVLRHPIPGLHMILSTRHEPPLPIASLRASSLLGEINTHDLRFTFEETKTLFNTVKRGKLDESMVDSIYRKMEGWVAGITLSVASPIQALEKRECVASSIDNQRYIMDYLTSEVLSRISPISRGLLYKASIPNELCAGLCDTLFQNVAEAAPSTGGITFLKRLVRENLFIAPVMNKLGWYTLHPVFRSVLQAKLEEHHDQEEIENLHSEAAYWLGNHGCLEGVLYHAEKVRSKAALDLFILIRQQLMEDDNWKLLEQWLGLFSAALIESNADLLLSKAWLMLINLRLPETALLLEKIAVMLSRNGTESELKRWGEFKTLQATYLMRMGEIGQAIEWANQAEENFSDTNSFVKAAIVEVKASAYRSTGDTAKWAGLLREYLMFSSTTNNYRLSLRLLTSMCTLNIISSRLAEAEKTANLMLSISRERRSLKYIGLANVYLGAVAYHRNELKLADDHFRIAIELVEHMDADGAITSYFGLAATEQALGHRHGAWAALEGVRSYLIAIHSLDLLPYVELFNMELMLRQGKNIHNGVDIMVGRQLLFADILYHPELTYCRHLIYSGQTVHLQEAISILTQLDETAISTCNDLLRIRVMALNALVFVAEGDLNKAQERLESAISIAEHSRCLRVFLDLGTPMASLIRRSELPQCGLAGELIEAFEQEMPYLPDGTSKILVENLTEQELRVLGFLKRRFSNKEIANELYVTTSTVKSHTIHIYQKLNVSSRREAVDKASRLGIFTI